MVTKEALLYVKKELGRGTSRVEIRRKLSQNGWRDEDIDTAIKKVYSPQYFENAPTRDEVIRIGPKIDYPLTDINLKSTILALVLILIMLIVYMIYGYNNYIFGPERALTGSFEKMANAKTFSFDGEINMTISSADDIDKQPSVDQIFTQIVNFGNNTQTYSFKLSGEVDAGESENINSEAKLIVSSSFAPIVNMDIRKVDELAYFKINGVLGKQFGEKISETGRWYEYDLADLQHYRVQVDMESAETNTNVENLNNLATKKSPIQNFKRVRAETLNSRRVNHFTYTVDEGNLSAFIDEFGVLYLSDYDDVKLYVDAISEFVDESEISNGHIWIGADGYIYKIRFDIVFKDLSNSDTLTQFEVSLAFDNYDKPIEIKTPDDTVSVDDLF